MLHQIRRMRIRSARKTAPAPLPRLGQPRPRIVDVPAPVGVRLLCLSLLDDAAAARDRLGVTDDAEALHDFRVALRRLRSTIRAYDSLLEDSIGNKLRRLLQRVARSTGPSRDLEVHIDWLSKVDAVPESSVDVAQELVHRLEERKQSADAEMRQEVERDFDRLNRRLRRALARYRGTIDPARPLGDTTAEAAAARIVHLTSELEGHLAAVRTSEDQDEAHEARIAAKRVRYVVEPFRKHIGGADELVDSFKELQTILGDLHDLHTLLAEMDTWAAKTAPPDHASWNEAVVRLRAEVHRQRDLLYVKTRSDWLEGNAEALFRQARSVASALRGKALPPAEIERKFLLRGMPRLNSRTAEVQRIEQGYLPGSIVTERIRYVRDNSGKHYFRTIKMGAGFVRSELEEETTEQVFRQMWPLTKGRRIRKRRYRVQDGALVWEVDRFDHISLVVAEVELPAADTPVVPPDWLTRYLDREVTGEPEFLNVNLAR
jgi:CHAD domain-containing protein/CYTH domain-containing protein